MGCRCSQLPFLGLCARGIGCPHLRGLGPRLFEVRLPDQDKDGKQGKRVWQACEQEAWARSLAGGDQAIAVFKRAAGAADVKLKWPEVGLKGTPSKIRDRWAHSDVKVFGPEFAASVPGHVVLLLRVK